MNIPPKVEDLVKEITEKSPGYSESQVWATAWSIYCKHVKPGDKHCTKGSGGYLTRKAALTPPRILKRRAPEGDYQVWMTREGDPNPYISDYPSIQVAMRRSRETSAMRGVNQVVIYDSLGNQFKIVKKAFNSPLDKLPDAQGKGWRVERRGDRTSWSWSDPHLGVKFGIFEIGDERNFLNNDTSYLLKVQGSDRKTYQARTPEMHLASAFHMAKKTLSAIRRGDDWSRGFTSATGRLAGTSELLSVSALPKVFKRVLKGIRFNKRKVHLRVSPSFSMYSAGDDGAKGFTIILDMASGRSQVAWGDWGGGGLGGIKPVDDVKTPKRALSDHMAIIQGQIGSLPYVNITVTDGGLKHMKGATRGQTTRQAFNKYNAPDVLGQLMALLQQFNLEEPLELMRRDKIPQAVDRAWKTRERQASRSAKRRVLR